MRSTWALLLVVAVWACDKKTDDGARPPAADGGTPVGDGDAPDPADDGSTPPGDRPTTEERTPMIASDHPLHGRLEGASGPNDCKQDSDCHKAGCSGEICSATTDMMSTCEVLPLELPGDAACGCVSGACQWWSPSGAKPRDRGGEGVPAANEGEAPDKNPESCDGQQCKPGQTCIEYFGIAGPRGPKFHSCETRCRKGEPNDGCPKGTKCVTVADGPGQVCR